MTERKRALSYYADIVSQSRKVYDVTDFVAAGTNQILRLAYGITKELFLHRSSGVYKSSMKASSQRDRDNIMQSVPNSQVLAKEERVKTWTEAFVRYPRAYLRITTCVDYSLANGRLPRDDSLPPLVRHVTSLVLGTPKLPWTVSIVPSTSEFQRPVETVVRRNAMANRADCARRSLEPEAPVQLSEVQSSYIQLSRLIEQEPLAEGGIISGNDTGTTWSYGINGQSIPVDGDLSSGHRRALINLDFLDLEAFGNRR
jgi:hypothetical protein